jgi:hypothetical protein
MIFHAFHDFADWVDYIINHCDAIPNEILWPSELKYANILDAFHEFIVQKL